MLEPLELNVEDEQIGKRKEKQTFPEIRDSNLNNCIIIAFDGNWINLSSVNKIFTS